MSVGAIKIIFISLITIAVLIETAADVLFKKWSGTSNTWFFVIAMVVYLVGTALWAFSLKYDFLSRAISMFTVLNMILVTLAGVLIFNEHLSFTNKIGFVLGLISIVLLQL